MLVSVRSTVYNILFNPDYDLYKIPAGKGVSSPVSFSFQKNFFGDSGYVLVPKNKPNHSYLIVAHRNPKSPINHECSLVISLLITSSCHTKPEEHRERFLSQGGILADTSEVLELLDISRLERIHTALCLCD